jgi:hypothetical protein
MMNRIRAAMIIVFGGFIMGCSGSGHTAAVVRPVNTPFTVLDGYGEWIDFPDVGRVWQPRVAFDWRPFYDGQWVWTDRGWMWFTDEPFGWVVYHYGYWHNRGPAGWVWIPEYEWSPARVRWIDRDDFVGWAPLPPPGVRLPEAHESGAANVWVVVPSQHFTREHVGNYRRSNPVPRGVNRMASDDRHGPDVKAVEQAIGQPIDPIKIETENVPAGERQLMRVKMVRKEVLPVTSPIGTTRPEMQSPQKEVRGTEARKQEELKSPEPVKEKKDRKKGDTRQDRKEKGKKERKKIEPPKRDTQEKEKEGVEQRPERERR